jgi:hypothetical protein
MSIPDILTRLYSQARKTGRLPSSRDRRVTAAFKEAYRKIGSGRKTLFIAGAVSNQRKRNYPQMSYVFDGANYRLDEPSIAILRKICVKNHLVKERIV